MKKNQVKGPRPVRQRDEIVDIISRLMMPAVRKSLKDTVVCEGAIDGKKKCQSVRRVEIEYYDFDDHECLTLSITHVSKDGVLNGTRYEYHLVRRRDQQHFHPDCKNGQFCTHQRDKRLSKL